MKANESILDFPKESLNPSIWIRLDDGTYALRDEVRSTILAIVDWAKSTFKMPNVGVNITGSNTSNSYSSGSDIDIHFNSPNFKVEKADDFNKIFRKKFEELVALKPELGEVNGVKTEVYMQANPFQDLMSVGCYDFLNNTWLVGPELKDTSFDPYAEYFTKDMKNVDDVIEDVRSTILQVYELAIALVKSNDIDFKKKTASKLKPLVSKAAKIFNALRAKRKRKSSPTSPEEAMKSRDDKDWQIADSSFKLLDKFGYLGILKACQQSVERFDEDLSDIEMAMKDVISTISDKISMHALDDSEECEFVAKLQEMDEVNESAKSMLSLAAVVGLLAIPNVLPASTLRKELNGKNLVGMTVNSPEVKKAISDATTGKSYNGMNATNIINAVARTIYAEARSEGEDGMKAVASVIWNRAGGKAENLVKVISKKKLFSCWNSYNGGWEDATFKFMIPSSVFKDKKNKAAWDKCVYFATCLTVEEFTSSIGNCNLYLNKKTADKKNVDGWGKLCNLKIGKHSFGYAKDLDGFRSLAKKDTTLKVAYTIKSGDTLGKIAKAHGTTVDKLLAANKDISNPNKIKVGLKILIA